MCYRFFSLVLLFLASAAYGDTLFLKDGQVIKGKIQEEASNYLIINIDGFPQRYYHQQIEKIEKDEPPAANGEPFSIDSSKFSSISRGKLQLIVDLLTQNRTRKNMELNLSATLAKIPEEKRSQVKELFNLDEITEKLIPLYDKYFNENDLKALVEFYKSPVGQKYMDATPAMTKEIIDVTVNYFKEKLPALNLTSPSK